MDFPLPPLALATAKMLGMRRSARCGASEFRHTVKQIYGNIGKPSCTNRAAFIRLQTNVGMPKRHIVGTTNCAKHVFG